ncbi:MAG: hypothetical protein PHV34_04360 [Verrucomicrobiae bacterium]|nr:hypothetical protein [Verrucomicrobiae bacterium]
MLTKNFLATELHGHPSDAGAPRPPSQCNAGAEGGGLPRAKWNDRVGGCPRGSVANPCILDLNFWLFISCSTENQKFGCFAKLWDGCDPVSFIILWKLKSGEINEKHIDGGAYNEVCYFTFNQRWKMLDRTVFVDYLKGTFEILDALRKKGGILDFPKDWSLGKFIKPIDPESGFIQKSGPS